MRGRQCDCGLLWRGVLGRSRCTAAWLRGCMDVGALSRGWRDQQYCAASAAPAIPALALRSAHPRLPSPSPLCSSALCSSALCPSASAEAGPRGGVVRRADRHERPQAQGSARPRCHLSWPCTHRHGRRHCQITGRRQRRDARAGAADGLRVHRADQRCGCRRRVGICANGQIHRRDAAQCSGRCASTRGCGFPPFWASLCSVQQCA